MSSEITSIAQFIDESAKIYPGRIALVFGAKKVTYSDLFLTSTRVAGALNKLGIKKGDKVALWMPNCPEFIYSFLGIARLGAVVVPVNNMLKREEARYVIEDSRAKILISSVTKISCGTNPKEQY